MYFFSLATMTAGKKKKRPSENPWEGGTLFSSVNASRKEAVSLQRPRDATWHPRMKLAQRESGLRDGEEVAESSWHRLSLDPTMPEAGTLTFLANKFRLLA